MDTLMELMDREREHGRMLHQEECIHTLMSARIAEALDYDETHDWSHQYEDLYNIKVTIGDLALITGYTIPDWLMKKAEEVKEARENG